MKTIPLRHSLIIGGGVLVLVILVTLGSRLLPKRYPGVTAVTFNFTHLPPLTHGHYEAWATFTFTRATVSLGKFQMSSDHSLADLSGNHIDALTTTQPIKYADSFFVTIEADGDTDSVPSDSVLLTGYRKEKEADLAFLDAAGLPSTGKAVLTTRTDPDTDIKSGIWLVNNAGEALIDLPSLAPGWQYGAYATIHAIELPMGNFKKVTEKDTFHEFSKKNETIKGVGEDFLRHLPRSLKDAGLQLPLDLTNTAGMVKITLEPSAHGNDPTGSGASPWTLFEGSLNASGEVLLNNVSQNTLPTGHLVMQ